MILPPSQSAELIYRVFSSLTHFSGSWGRQVSNSIHLTRSTYLYLYKGTGKMHALDQMGMGLNLASLKGENVRYHETRN